MNLNVVTILLLVFFLLSCGTSPSPPGFETEFERGAPKDVTTSSVLAATPKPNSTRQPEEEFREALEDIWIEADQLKLNDFTVTRYCKAEPQNNYLGSCELFIKSKRKTLRSFAIEHGNKKWLKYGLFNFLGTDNQQLVVFTYSGGAHCCYDYTIFDLTPRLRMIYDSSSSDSANDVGNELVPVDIDKDGIFEFHRDVMAFDYMGAGGHAGSSFPPAILAYDKRVGKYILANKRFPEFVTNQLDYLLSGLETAAEADVDTIDEFRVRTRFLYMVYAGQHDAGWKYFEENYKSASGDGYQEQFKEQFKREFLDRFSNDPTYISIYGRK